ncbi:helix-turn-helix domain-containing protein [Streptomyces sp. NPDC020412]|uniref:helix-turn-helix domain-containing protein n=1 Tax=Streptomyces sp. NPDC020412 TaxID=3365073 RepID=UPI00379B6DEA
MQRPVSPAALPSTLRADPRIRAALARRDIGAVFALAHDEGGLSYNKIAEACDIRPERVSKMARGDGTVTSLPVLERVCDGLQLPGACLGLAARPWETGAPPPIARTEEEEDPVKRRDILRGALAAGLAGPGLAAALTTTRTDLDAALAAADHATIDLDHWSSTAERYGHGYHGQAPVAVLSDLIAEFEELRPLLDRPQTDRDRATLAHVTAQMAGMVSIVLHDLGHHRESHGWSATAARAAERSGDHQLHAWVLAREAMVPLNFGAAPAAAKLADTARHLAGSQPSPAGALAAAVAARAHAVSGDRERALAAVTDVERVAERLTPQQREDTWFGYPTQKHHVHLSQALTHLGETRRAYETQAAALTLSRSPSVMTRALIAIDEASCRVQDGERETAARIASQAFGELPEPYRTGLTRTRATALYRTLPSDTPGRDALADALAIPG